MILKSTHQMQIYLEIEMHTHRDKTHKRHNPTSFVNDEKSLALRNANMTNQKCFVIKSPT